MNRSRTTTMTLTETRSTPTVSTSPRRTSFTPFSGVGHTLGGTHGLSPAQVRTRRAATLGSSSSIPIAPPPPTLSPRASVRSTGAAITPELLQQARSRLRVVRDVALAPDLQHIRAKREAGGPPAEGGVGYNVQPVGPNPMRQLPNYQFVDFYTDARREIAFLRSPVQNAHGHWIRSEGDQLVSDVNRMAARRVQANQFRAAHHLAPLPDLSVGVRLGAFAMAMPHNFATARAPMIGSGSDVYFDPTSRMNPGADVPHEPFVPPAMVLGHELIHARGMQQGRQDNNWMREEFLTVGLIPGRRYTENMLRQERGFYPRVAYMGQVPAPPAPFVPPPPPMGGGGGGMAPNKRRKIGDN